MYKTVRQGENSLQYTILPQTEEVLNNSGVIGKGRDYSPTNKPTKKSERRFDNVSNYLLICLLAFVLISGLIFSLIGALGIVPVNRSNKTCQDSWLRKTIKYTAQSMIDRIRKEGTHLEYPTTEHPDATTVVTDLNDSQINGKTTMMIKPSEASIELTSQWEQITPTKVKDVLPSGTIYPLDATDFTKMMTPTTTVDKTSYYPDHQRQSNNDLMLKHESWSDYDDDDDDVDYDITKIPSTVMSKTNKVNPLIVDSSVIESATQIVYTTPPTVTFTTVLNQNLTNNISSVDDRDKNRVPSKMDAVKFKETKERILDDDDEDEYKEPLTDEDDVSEQTKGDDVKIKAQTKSWLQIRWPFVDPSSYFQWTGYSARDNLLLPAILSAALSALLVLAVLCYALRRRQRCKRRNQEIGNLTSELQAEDNANLLTAEHSSEDE